MKLIAPLYIIVCLLILPAAGIAADEPATHRNVNVDEFEKLWKEKKHKIVDVRSPKEFVAGHIPGSINIDVNAPDFDKTIIELKKDQPLLIHCASGVRSVKACQRMHNLEFTNLYNLVGGFKAWEKAGKEIEKPARMTPISPPSRAPRSSQFTTAGSPPTRQRL